MTKLSNNPSLDNERKENLVDIAEAIKDQGIRRVVGEETAQEVQKQLERLVQMYKNYNEIEPPFEPAPFDPTPDQDFDVYSIDSFQLEDNPIETKVSFCW